MKNNLVDTFCTVKHDGAIYTCGEPSRVNRQVLGNILVRGIGDRNGLPEPVRNTHGLYMDYLTGNVDIRATHPRSRTAAASRSTSRAASPCR